MSDWIGRRVGRIGDMHPRRSLTLTQTEDGDIQVFIGEVLAYCDHEGNDTLVEFCSLTGGGGRSSHTRKALLALMEAMKLDNDERGDADPAKVFRSI